MKMKKGMMIHAASSIFGGSRSCANSFCGVRRYLMAIQKMTTKMRMETVPVTMHMKMNSAST